MIDFLSIFWSKIDKYIKKKISPWFQEYITAAFNRVFFFFFGSYKSKGQLNFQNYITGLILSLP